MLPVGQICFSSGQREQWVCLDDYSYLKDMECLKGVYLAGEKRQAGGLLSGGSFCPEEWMHTEEEGQEQEPEKLPRMSVKELVERRLFSESYTASGECDRGRLYAYGFTYCIRIDLNDLEAIGVNTRENSFLCHSFHRYGHLLLAVGRKEDDNGQRPGEEPSAGVWLLAPGVACAREKAMSELFGFTGFCTVRECRRVCGVGYWCLRLPFLFEPDAERTEELL